MNPLLLSNHAVWQRGAALTLEGAARPGALVRVAFRGKTWEVTADNVGRWRIVLGPFEAGGPDDVSLMIGDEPPTVARDVLVGEVWVCSGQSNMEMALKDADGGPEEAARVNDAGFRLFTVPRRVEETPQNEIEGARWQRCTPESANAFSAVGFWFGLLLHEALGVPVGLIQAAVGATPAESWVHRGVVENNPDFHPILERWRKSLAAFPDTKGEYAKAFAAWDGAADLAEREGRPIPGAFPKLISPGHPWTPGGLFNAMIAPLTRVPIAGVTWYQGAGAPDRAYQYRSLFRSLICDWRRVWGREDLPFLFVQEARFGPRREQPAEHSWAELREAQVMALAEPRTAMVVSIDTGDEKNIHPPEKRPLGERLTLAARSIVYGQNIAWSGPTLSAKPVIEGTRIRLRFAHTHGGLRTSDGAPLKGFAISGGAKDFSAGNRGFVWADAKIEGDDVVVWSDQVPKPVAVRYAWAQNPDCNLVNGVGIPAAPFRTDDWPGVTVNNR